MNIAFDAKRAYNNGTGLGHYSRTLISSLAGNYPENEYFLCTPKISDRFNTAAYKNVHVVSPQHFPSTIFTSLWRSSWVKKDLQQLHIELYHGLSHEIPVGIERTGIGTVVTIHDLIFERYPKQYNPIDVQIYRSKFSNACKHANRIIAISEQTKQDIIQFYKIPGQKIEVCYQSCHAAFGFTVDEAEKQRIKQLYRLPDHFYLYVGSIIERKNLLTICKAIQLLGKKLPYPLLVIGEGGAYKKEVLAYIKQNGLDNSIRLLSDEESIKNIPGYRTAADFPAIYQQASAMIYPSIFEGFGIPVLEALWSKIPVITSNISCLPEAGGPGAFYIDPFNQNELAAVMLQVAEDDVLRQQSIATGWQYAQRFTQAACAEAVMQVYKQI